MQINGLGGFGPLKKSDKRDRISGAGEKAAPQKAAPSAGSSSAKRTDAVQISAGGAAMSKLAQVPDVRQERVEAIRSEIDQGTYLTPEKVEDGLRKMLRDL